MNAYFCLNIRNIYIVYLRAMDAVLQVENFTQIRFAVWFEPISGKKNMRR